MKTRPTKVSVAEFLGKKATGQQLADSRELIRLFREITGSPPKMWGPSIVGFGQYHYRYDSGHEGDMARLGFSPRSTELVFYLLPGFEGYEHLMERLGKHRTGKCCLYIKRLSDVDEAVLEEIAVAGLDYMREKYPEGA